MTSNDERSTAADPVVSVDLFCGTHGGRAGEDRAVADRAVADRAVAEIIAPVWRRLVAPGAEDSARLWFSRQTRDGSRLEIHIHGNEHGDASCRERARGLILEAATRSFPGLTSRDEDDDQSEVEDEIAAPRLTWVRPARNPLLFGGPKLANDDRFVRHFVDCVTAGCDLVLPRFGAGSRPTVSERQRAFMRIVVVALSALWDSRDRARYLTYHRDWAVRFLVLRARREPRKAKEILERYRRAHDSLTPASRAVIRTVGEPLAEPVDLKSTASSAERAWARSLRALCADDGVLGGCPALEPFVDDPRWTTVLKIFHAVANQLGLDILNEGLAFDLLSRSLARSQENGFSLVPLDLGDHRNGGDDRVGDDDAARPARQAFDFENQYSWIGLVAATGTAGEAWRDRYRALGGAIGGKIKTSVAVMRRGRLEEGREILAEVEADCRRLAAKEASLAHVLGRFYFGSLAYYDFRIGNWSAADRDLGAAGDSIRAAVDSERFLMPFAPLIADIPMKRARLACEQHRWDDMAAELEFLRDIKLDRRPICTLGDGSAVHHHSIASLLAESPSFPDQHRLALRYLSEPGFRRDHLARTVEDAYTPSEIFVAYRRLPS